MHQFAGTGDPVVEVVVGEFGGAIAIAVSALALFALLRISFVWARWRAARRTDERLKAEALKSTDLAEE